MISNILNENKTKSKDFFLLYRNREKLLYIASFLNLDEKFSVTYINKNSYKILHSVFLKETLLRIKLETTNIFKANSLTSILEKSSLLSNIIPNKKISDIMSTNNLHFFISLISARLNVHFIDNPVNRKNSKNFSIKGINIGLDSPPFLASLLNQNKSLEKIDLSKEKATNNFSYSSRPVLMASNHAFEILGKINNDKNWLSLNLSRNEVCDSDKFLSLINCFKFLKTLKELDFSYMNLRSNEILELSKSIPQLKMLEKLNISNNILDKESSQALFISLSQMGNFRSLNISSCKINNKSLAKLEVLLENPSVKELNLRDNDFSEDIPREFEYALMISKLTILTMENCLLKDSSAKSILSSFYPHLHIQYINLSSNFLGNNIFHVLKTLLIKNSSLKQIRLDNDDKNKLTYLRHKCGAYSQDFFSLKMSLKNLNSSKIKY
jgi:hypothetical protein